MSCTWLDPVNKDDNNIYYSLDNIKTKHEVRNLDDHDSGYLVLDNKEEDWLRFAVLEFVSSKYDGTDVKVNMVFHGDGPSNNLRELRHTWWGNEGYLFYPNFKTIKSALDMLLEFYDGN